MRRSYFPYGQLRWDSLAIRDGGSYGLRYDYNTATGQLPLLHHPENLAWSGAVDEYQYDPVTGVLAELLDRSGNRFSFNYDKAGRFTSGLRRGESRSRGCTTWTAGSRGAGSRAL